jgi:outer membrane protein TolC
VLRLGLPLFGQGQGARARANAELRRTRRDRTATAIELRADARATRQRALAAYAEARQLRDVVLPLRQQILDETLLHYNAMNASTVELLLARRELVDAGQQYVDALRSYWSAMTEVTALRRGVMRHP